MDFKNIATRFALGYAAGYAFQTLKNQKKNSTPVPTGGYTGQEAYGRGEVNDYRQYPNIRRFMNERPNDGFTPDDDYQL